VLVDGLGLRHLVAGYDFHFGKGRQGSPETLRRASAAGHFGLTVVEPVTAEVAGATPVASSSAVRQALATGDVGGAAAMLGHWWRVVGPVTGGFKRGTGMGYPTANVRLPAGCGLAHGIYAARVYVGGTRHAGAAYLGTRPTFDNGQAVLETFLLDFDDSLYGKTIAVEFIEHLREDRAFPDAAALIEQIDRDVRATRDILATFASDDPLAWPAEAPVTY
jgi:riboflavin kinase/FMN adenylyltransferase